MDSYSPLSLPTSGQYVTFPLDQQKVVTVAWREGKITRSAQYYVSKCYWGIEKSPPDQNKGKNGPSKATQVVPVPQHPVPEVLRKGGGSDNALISVLGETRLFIAAEYIEDAYSKGVMEAYHLKDLARQAGNGNPRWITLKLNDCFHYGQNRTGEENSLNTAKWRRWIVYHPPISSSIEPPNMFQHRFTSPGLKEFLSFGFSYVAEETPQLHKQGLIEMITGITGNPLHPFLGDRGHSAAQLVTKKINQKLGKVVMPAGSAELVRPDPSTMAVQYVEWVNAKSENEADKRGERVRIREAAQALSVIAAKQQGWRYHPGPRDMQTGERVNVSEERTIADLKEASGLYVDEDDQQKDLITLEGNTEAEVKQALKIPEHELQAAEQKENDHDKKKQDNTLPQISKSGNPKADQPSSIDSRQLPSQDAQIDHNTAAQDPSDPLLKRNVGLNKNDSFTSPRKTKLFAYNK